MKNAKRKTDILYLLYQDENSPGPGKMTFVHKEEIIQDLDFIASLDERNRLTVKKEVIEILGLKKGDKLNVKVLAVYKLEKVA